MKELLKCQGQYIKGITSIIRLVDFSLDFGLNEIVSQCLQTSVKPLSTSLQSNSVHLTIVSASLSATDRLTALRRVRLL